MEQMIKKILTENILPFWLNKMEDNENGGFYGRIDGHDHLVADAEKGAILNARLLWSFASAYRLTGDVSYLKAAQRAKNYIIDHFIDKEYGGVYWSLDCKGEPTNSKKQTYAIGFTIYGMAEMARAANDEEALEVAKQLFNDIETHAFDSVNNGYIEALTREWQPIADMRLSDKDENGSKTMNTHLHILEPYTNLFRVWKDQRLEQQLRNLIDIFCDIIRNPKTGHLDLFFNDQWQGKRNIESFGHDIEASWLLHESALVLGDKEVLQKVEPTVKDIARAADEGLQENGAMIYERWKDSDESDADLHWWVQCENVIGHYNLYQHFDDEKALDIVKQCLHFIDSTLIDWQNGEWHWSQRADGTINLDDDKAGFWKCPYHNTRMCTELLERMKE